MDESKGVGDVHSTAKGSGARFNNGKAPLSLIPLRFIAESYRSSDLYKDEPTMQWVHVLDTLGEFQEVQDRALLYRALAMLGPRDVVWRETGFVFAYGKEKYCAWNWAKGMEWAIPLECAARHLVQMIEGEWSDTESQLPHRGHVGCNLVMLLHYQTTFPEGNNLPPTELFHAV